MWELMGFHADEQIEFQETWDFNVFQQAQWIGLEGILRLKALVHGLSMKMPSPSRVFLESFESSQCPGFQHGPIIHSMDSESDGQVAARGNDILWAIYWGIHHQ